MIGSAHAHSTTSSRGSTTGITSSTTSRRIFCFGDSLTAGTSDDVFVRFPYAPHLERALRARSHTTNVVVRHCGLPGWTSQELLAEMDGNPGLRTAIRAAQPLALVILLAGTNDLGYYASTGDPTRIVQNLIQLHEACHKEGVPKTLAIGIPPSGYQSQNAAAAQLVQNINAKLREYCGNTATKATYMDFPFDFSPTEGNFALHGLHFTQQGYELLGESLAPVVSRILEESS